ncbi:hypothetical protein GH714_026694 [Hevea brasiliensis]|uniref:Retrotransposon gag domain-containing protein n=1 Tax=Hevea brasiliensis TaxID=3981 RepID=A0A6A6M116_HEVBR|nr:hypothetical protein GH714_026694 [Hevea brasiliensis]
MEKGVNDKLHHLEEAINKMTALLMTNSTTASSSNTQDSPIALPLLISRNDSHNQPEGNTQDSPVAPPLLISRNDSHNQPEVFEYHGTTESQKVPLASFHLEGEANQWWQWLKRSYKEENKMITLEIFYAELWARFGPTDDEDFDEALSKIKQVGSLSECQKEFENLGNRVQGWTKRALVGTFMGCLKPEVADGIRMFKPTSLKEAISLARMRDG